MKNTLVVCIGNRLVGDDAVGPVIYDKLKEMDLSQGAELKLLGVGGIALLDFLDGQDRLIVVDAVRFGAPSGTLHLFSGETLRTYQGMPVTSHDISLRETIAVGETLYPEKMPMELVFLGIEGESFDELGSPLSPSVAAVVNRAVETVLEHIRT